MSLASDVAKKIKARKLNMTDAAAKIGVTYPSLKATLDGSSLPNARSLGKYAKFLGVAKTKLEASVEKERDAKGIRPGRPAGSTKKKAAKKVAKKAAKKVVKKAAKKKAAKKAAKKPVKKAAKKVVKKAAKKKVAKKAAKKKVAKKKK